MERLTTLGDYPEEAFGAYFPHEVWEVKTIPIDLMLTDGRATILGIRDSFTGRAKFVVIPLESVSAIRGAIAGTIEEWGTKPVIIEIDSSRLVYASLRPTARTLFFILKKRRASQPQTKSPLERLFCKATLHYPSLRHGFAHLNSIELQRQFDAWAHDRCEGSAA